MIRFILGMVVLLVAACFATGQAEQADKKAVVKQVFDAWKERRTKVTRVRYVASGETIVIKGSMSIGAGKAKQGTPLPKTDVSCPQKVTFLIDFATKKFRLDKESTYLSAETQALKKQAGTLGYNGKELWQTVSRPPEDRSPENPDAIIVTGNLREAAFTLEDWPFFISHGIVPSLSDLIIPGRFSPKLDEKEFYYHGTAAHAGRNCVVLRTELGHFTGKSFNEYWVDLGRGGAVLRQLAYVNNVPVQDLDMRYEETAAGWLVAGWATSVRNKGKTLRIFKMRVDARELEPAVSDADFAYTVSPEMNVKKLHRGGNEESIAPAYLAKNNTEQTFIVDEKGKMKQTGGTPAPKSHRWWWLGGGSLLLLLLLGGWLWRGRRRAAPKQ